ncbi:cupin domain-containing protein [Candidatus Kaiserbacteria bacterium CG10_big_fil_rev_8_21_14_0_10_59_10]|uniref:Cupin domain-containing protein n=1 Tax=Candidatus Kaiserbacteria bacterium CG10_big_fil_rev_8_21_14_0_10_59_10 TaxID=1974612 RepID=A0A2H0U7J7_9BACT|nr:MAG: cupin domain-containing protein [Candidatus Kaiserbacteria bacterium CG10_big_fil_rev_8_21_14_0_10_59_10]
MKGYVGDIQQETLENNDFRRVLYTAEHMQLVVMSILPRGDIGEEVHTLDQFVRVEAGEGEAVLGGARHAIQAGSAVVITAGMRHNIINTSAKAPLKLYSLYAPPEHRDGVVHRTKVEASADEEHFDGVTTD